MKSDNLNLSTDNEISKIYQRIRNYLAGRAIGITRDKSLLHEVVKCLFCKVRLSESKEVDSLKDIEDIAKHYRQEFTILKKDISHIFSKNEEILLDPSSINYIHQELSRIDLTNSHKDPLGQLYQAFIDSDLRVTEGQFFTPRQAISWLVEAIEPKIGEKIMDPACGPGGFLSYTASYLLSKGANRKEINSNLYGIEKDDYLSKLANAHIALTTLRKANIYCADSIDRKDIEGKPISIKLNNTFDVVLANPPFGAKIKTGSKEVRRGFELAHKWKSDKKSGKVVKTDVLQTNTPPQILFLELCLNLLKPGGRLGIVVPESLISNSSTSYVIQFLRKNATILAVCGMPESLFKTSGKGGTHTKTCLLLAKRKTNNTIQNDIFMAEAHWCGHDSRGNKIPHNDLPIILSKYKKGMKESEYSHLGYKICNESIVNNILTPRYYDPGTN